MKRPLHTIFLALCATCCLRLVIDCYVARMQSDSDPLPYATLKIDFEKHRIVARGMFLNSLKVYGPTTNSLYSRCRFEGKGRGAVVILDAPEELTVIDTEIHIYLPPYEP